MKHIPFSLVAKNLFKDIQRRNYRPVFHHDTIYFLPLARLNVNVCHVFVIILIKLCYYAYFILFIIQSLKQPTLLSQEEIFNVSLRD